MTMTAERKASQRVRTRQRRQGEIRAKRVYNQRMADQRVIAARRSHRHRMWRKSAGIGLTVLAAAVAVFHLLDHQNAFHLMSQQVLEDILVGYPTAFGLLIVAAIVAWPKVSH